MRASGALPLFAAAVAAALVLTGCSGGSAPDQGPVPTVAATPAPTPDPSVVASVAECDEVVLESGERIEGERLGSCVAAAMVAAGTGTQRVDSSDGTSSIVQFRWDPDYSMSVDGGEQQVVISGDTGWARMPEIGWVQADPASDDPTVMMVTGLVGLVRAAADPQTLAAGIATAPGWTVLGEEGVPADDAVADVAWHLVPDSTMTLAGVVVSDIHLWLRSDHLGAYFVGTGSYGGISVTTSNTFLQWSGPVDIADPTIG
jgi:hypothetical protein